VCWMRGGGDRRPFCKESREVTRACFKWYQRSITSWRHRPDQTFFSESAPEWLLEYVWQQLLTSPLNRFRCISRSHVAFSHSVLIMPPKPARAQSATPTNAFQSLWKAYNDNTPDRLKFIDAFLFFLMLSGIVQFAYCILVTNFPYNAFLAGYVGIRHLLGLSLTSVYRFSSNVGQFVLAASLRSQVNPENKDEFKDVSPERYVSARQNNEIRHLTRL